MTTREAPLWLVQTGWSWRMGPRHWTNNLSLIARPLLETGWNNPFPLRQRRRLLKFCFSSAMLKTFTWNLILSQCFLRKSKLKKINGKLSWGKSCNFLNTVWFCIFWVIICWHQWKMRSQDQHQHTLLPLKIRLFIKLKEHLKKHKNMFYWKHLTIFHSHSIWIKNL